jgi:hypothetical protein
VANIGWCTRLGWFNGFRLLIAVNPEGTVTGSGFGEGSAKDQPLAETILALRQHPDSPIPSVGLPALGPHVLNTGFEGEDNHRRWRLLLRCAGGLQAEDQQSQGVAKSLTPLAHSIPQMVETVYAKLMDFFRLDKERPHTLTEFQANLAAKMALHNFCIWLNKQFGREPLAFADLLGW